VENTEFKEFVPDEFPPDRYRIVFSVQDKITGKVYTGNEILNSIKFYLGSNQELSKEWNVIQEIYIEHILQTGLHELQKNLEKAGKENLNE